MKTLKEYGLCLVNQQMMPTGLKVSIVVGSILFIINHGSAVVGGKMNRDGAKHTPDGDRWISVGVTYLIPYMVNIHGQYVSRSRKS
jgi:hypothetical protein